MKFRFIFAYILVKIDVLLVKKIHVHETYRSLVEFVKMFHQNLLIHFRVVDYDTRSKPFKISETTRS